jgi:chromosome segregation ATPase
LSDNRFSALSDALSDALRDAEAVPATDDSAIEFVGGLSGALELLPALLSRTLDLVEVAALGKVSSQHVLDKIDELTQLRQRLDADRRALNELRPVLADLRVKAAERDQIADELTELRRLESLAGDLFALRAQRKKLQARHAELTAVSDEEVVLRLAATDLLVLTAAQLVGVEERIRDTITEADATDGRLAEARVRLAGEQSRLDTLSTELAAAVDGFTALREESERRLPSLEAYRQADRDLLAGLTASPLTKGSGLDQANSALDEVEQRLDTLTAALGTALARHDETHKAARSALGLT